jgi:ABC-2 type transport system ATP-binding protein
MVGGAHEHHRDETLALWVDRLVKKRGGRTVLDGVDLDLWSGTVLALLGRNGAGKTTLVEVCEGFLRADGGQVRVCGMDPAGAPRPLRVRVGVMPQGGGAYPAVRVRHMLRLIAACARYPLDIDWLIDILGLGSCEDIPYKRLSTGQRQRLALACAVVGRPELVFLDEPTAGMDPQARRVVWELIDALRADGVAVLVTTHLVDEAEHLADDIAILDAGRIVARGSPGTLIASSGASTVLRFRSQPDLDTADIACGLPDDCTVSETFAGHYTVRGSIDPRVLASVASWFATQGLIPDNLRVTRQDLTDVFFELTGHQVQP